MKYKNIFVAMFLVIVVTDLSFIDDSRDKTKSILEIEYSDGTMDQLIVDRKDVNPENIQRLVHEADKIIMRKTGVDLSNH